MIKLDLLKKPREVIVKFTKTVIKNNWRQIAT